MTAIATTVTARHSERILTKDRGSGRDLYTDGELIDTIPVTLLFTRTTFNAAGMCSIAGKMDVDGNTVHMTIQSSTCQGFSPGMEYNSTYELSDNGDVMTTWTDRQGAEIKEVYHRKED